MWKRIFCREIWSCSCQIRLSFLVLPKDPMWYHISEYICNSVRVFGFRCIKCNNSSTKLYLHKIHLLFLGFLLLHSRLEFRLVLFWMILFFLEREHEASWVLDGFVVDMMTWTWNRKPHFSNDMRALASLVIGQNYSTSNHPIQTRLLLSRCK